MGYAHIDNLYKNQKILAFRQVWALEKVHGTSAHVSWNAGRLGFFGGGESHERFAAIFDHAALTARLTETFGIESTAIIYGEAYGGKQQRMSETYGPDLRFIAFDVKVGDEWLDVPSAAMLVEGLGLEFVPHRLIDGTLAAIDAQRDLPSEVAARRGITEPKVREGVVLRPPFEVTTNNGERICAKHKRDEFRETKAPRVVDDPAKLAMLTAADAVAAEWVTPMRLAHVLDKLLTGGDAPTMQRTPAVLAAMVDDVIREAGAEIADTKETRKAIQTAASKLYAQHVKRVGLGLAA